ncbi:MAG: hypothetical protein CVU56_08040 [Deltaproteobacteria bacterium HGW-Deltaproteobacteria-14]|jgi:hypothetical protein|nr:MAG: hypothetical protein CVU56_08040 [Deltaproteobacteria bacterium HGW-Deltaproteobacteria-14]
MAHFAVEAWVVWRDAAPELPGGSLLRETPDVVEHPRGGAPPARRSGLLRRVVSFYADGFRAMTLGRVLWRVVLIKLAILLALAIALQQSRLSTRFDTDAERAAHVLGVLTSGTPAPHRSEVTPCPSKPRSSSGPAPSSR